MKLGNYVHELLKDNETVIIPGFGAFYSKYEPAAISETEIRPPSKKTSFTTNIRNNDGLLVDFVAHEENVSHFDALKIIEKERDQMVFLLDKGREVILDEFGKLSSGVKGEIAFTSYGDESLSVETFGLEAVSLAKLAGELRDDETLYISKQPEEQDTKEIPINISEGTGENSNKLIDETIAVGERSEPVKDINVDESNQFNVSVQEAIPEQEKPDRFEEPVFVTLEPESVKKDTKKVLWYWYLLILIPLIVAGILISNKINDTNSKFTNSNSIVIQQNTPGEKLTNNVQNEFTDTVKTIQFGVTTQDSATTVQSEEITEVDTFPGHPVFYLVGGSFKDEENARDYMQELKEKELEPFFLGKRGNFYMVGVGKFATEGQATRARDIIWEKYPGAGLWVMKE